MNTVTRLTTCLGGNHVDSIKHISTTISILLLLLKDLASLSRHDSTLLRLVILLEIITHLFKSSPFHALMFADMINDPLMHLQSMRSTAHVRMDSHGEAETFLSFILVEVVEVVQPLLFEGCGVDLESREVSLFLAEILNVF